MTKKLSMVLVAGILGATAASSVSAYDGDWKRGRVYYRMVCTACHVEKGGSIAPSTKTKAEWAAYFAADKHAKGKDSVKYYVSKKYRDSIKATNKAAEKYADVPEAELLEDVKAFANHGAKDSDTPAGCS
jgi:cytochrome c1